jgi:hypothetical protein
MGLAPLGADADGSTGVNVRADPQVRFAPGARSSGVHPFRLDAMAHIRLRVVVNGVEADAILDTGAARTVLDDRFASQLGLAIRPGFRVAGITGMTTGSWAEPIRVEIGDLIFGQPQPGLLDLGPLTVGAGERASLLIGHDLFARAIADFDFNHGVLSFLKPSSVDTMTAGYTAPMGMTPGGTPYVSLAINGGPAIHAAIDIGYNGSLMVAPAYAAAASLLTGRPTSTVASVGAEGLSINSIATCGQMEFAGNRLTGVPMEVPAAWNRTIPAVLGLDVLRRFRMVTDFGRQRVSFIPDDDLAGQRLPKDRSGIGGRPTADGVIVVHVADGSPAETIGLKAGDVIKRINGELADLDYVCRNPRLGAGPAGTRFLLQIDDDRVATLILSEYY